MAIFEAERQQEEYDRQHDRELLDPIREELEAALLEVGVEDLRLLLRAVANGKLVPTRYSHEWVKPPDKEVSQ